MNSRHNEFHRVERIGWLRAAVLGANDGIISTASLLIGIAAAHTQYSGILIAGIAALLAGTMSMAAGEYISVSSQADTEKAETEKEILELKTDLPAEIEELTTIYVKYGLDRGLAAQVAKQLMTHDALEAHLRDELGITETRRSRPLQAALFSASSFAIGSILPIISVMIIPTHYFIPAIFVIAIIFLLFLGGLAAKIGGSNIIVGAARVSIWGALAMLLTAIIGALLGTI
jgi:VIT1/CCC1 family predicted Fe2+/Mn2+ transporter